MDANINAMFQHRHEVWVMFNLQDLFIYQVTEYAKKCRTLSQQKLACLTYPECIAIHSLHFKMCKFLFTLILCRIAYFVPHLRNANYFAYHFSKIRFFHMWTTTNITIYELNRHIGYLYFAVSGFWIIAVSDTPVCVC